MKMKLLLPVFSAALLLLAFSACQSSKELLRDYNYFEKNGDTLQTLVRKLSEPIIQKNDQLSIMVHSASLNQDQAEVFNLLNRPAAGGAGITTQGYLVDFDGYVNLPVIGRQQAAGLTKTALAKVLVEKISPYIKDPVINIRFLNFRVMLLGEVASKGPQTFPNERATIVDAIAQAGGLTDQGMRTNIMVFRELPDGRHHVDTVNMNDARIFGANAYQLQQNDVVYVSPNTNKLKSINTNPTLYRDIPFITSMVSTALALLFLIFR